MWLRQAVKKNNELDILIYGIIGGGWWDTVDAKAVQAELQEYGNDIDTINIRIHSPGGSISEGCAIYNALKHHPAKKVVYIEGECSSIATVVAMAGDEIVMSPVSRIMIHDPLVMYISGGSEKLRAQADTLDKLKEVIINAYVTKSKLSREVISDLMSKETHMTAEEALEKGFITKIEDLGSTMNYYMQNFAGGEMNINTKKETQNKTEVENMSFRTKDEFKNQFPEMYQEIIAEGVNLERERIKELDEMLDPEMGEKAMEIIADAKYKNFKNFGEIAKDLFKNIKHSPIPPQAKKSEEKDFIGQFEKKKQEAEESNVGKVPGIDTTEQDGLEETEAKNILDAVVNLANN